MRERREARRYCSRTQIMGCNARRHRFTDKLVLVRVECKEGRSLDCPNSSTDSIWLGKLIDIRKFPKHIITHILDLDHKFRPGYLINYDAFREFHWLISIRSVLRFT